MRRLLLLLLFLPLAVAQDTLKTEATDAMPVCTSPRPDSSPPCATPPRPVKNPQPSYSEKARKSHREGTVTLSLVVDARGKTRDIQVIKSLGGGLDEEAVNAVKEWTFEPGTYDGKAVSVQLKVEISFRLTAAPASDHESDESATPAAQLHKLEKDNSDAYNRGDYQTAAELARRIVVLAPQDSVAWNRLGAAQIELHELDEAASALETSISLDPESPFAYNNLGRVYWQQRKYDLAAAQFRKQIAVNPDGHHAHTNLGQLLAERKMCGDAVPQLQKAIAILPNNPGALEALGDCHIQLGNKEKGLSELKQATSQASASWAWNGAAYRLAQDNTELDQAQKWVESAISADAAKLHSISLDHLSPQQLSWVEAMCFDWDTMGWVLFRRGKFEEAADYARASWLLHQNAVVGYHLGQIYEALGKRDEALSTYAMAVASADSPLVQPLDPDNSEGLAGSNQGISKLSREDMVAQILSKGRADLAAMGQISLPNSAKSSGSGDFVVNISFPSKTSEVRQITGPPAISSFAAAIQSASLPVGAPKGSTVEIVRRGTLTCASPGAPCILALLNAQDALNVSRKENADAAMLSAPPLPDPHVYENVALGMKISLPNEWRLVREEPGSFGHPGSAILGKSGAVALLILTRERLEGSPDLYLKMIDAGLSKQDDYQHTAEMSVTIDGIQGTRWNARWKTKGVSYKAIMEFFSVGDDHYRLTALAPTEVYERYAMTFEDLLRSVHFPMLHNDPKLLPNP